MTVRYDDALPTLIRIADDADVDLASDGVIVLRDARGRLGIVWRDRAQASRTLSTELKSKLGGYALPEPVIDSRFYESISSGDPKAIWVGNADRGHWINLVDRRIVGADWLLEISEPKSDMPRLVFGSLKGGVGRSTALAVLAADLAARGKRVLCIDLDLEAPGLSSMLLPRTDGDDRRPKYGALDYLVENGLNRIEDDELYDFIGVSPTARGTIEVLPAVGRITDEHPENMIGKLARGLIEDIQSDQRLSVAVQMREMVDRFAERLDSDVVLIDARAGLSEVTAGSWLALGANKLLLFGIDQPQTYHGYRYVLAHLMQRLGTPPDDSSWDWRQVLSFVQSKAPSSKEGRVVFLEQIHALCEELLYEEASGAELDRFSYDLSDPDLQAPHNASYIAFHPDYSAFDPVRDANQLSAEVYRGPFGGFLERMHIYLNVVR